MYLEKFKLDGRIAVVTGGGQGIGLACAEALGEAGARTVIADRDPAMAEAGCAQLKAKGYAAEALVMDVTDSAQVAQVAHDLAMRHGKVDILVNNAGIARSETPAEKVADEHWLNVIDVNLNGTFWCCRAFGRHMLEARSGAIVNIGSMSGFIGSPKMNFVSGPPASLHRAATIGIRPEHLRVVGDGEGWPGRVSVAEHLGSDTFLYVDAAELGLLTVRGLGEVHLKEGDRIWLSPDPARLHRFDKEGVAIRP